MENISYKIEISKNEHSSDKGDILSINRKRNCCADEFLRYFQIFKLIKHKFFLFRVEKSNL